MKYISVCAGIEAATQGWHHMAVPCMKWIGERINKQAQ